MAKDFFLQLETLDLGHTTVFLANEFIDRHLKERRKIIMRANIQGEKEYKKYILNFIKTTPELNIIFTEYVKHLGEMLEANEEELGAVEQLLIEVIATDAPYYKK